MPIDNLEADVKTRDKYVHFILAQQSSVLLRFTQSSPKIPSTVGYATKNGCVVARIQTPNQNNVLCISGPHLWKLRAVSNSTRYTRVSEVASNYFLFSLNQYSDHRCRLTKSTPVSPVLRQRLLDFSSIPYGISSPLSISPTPRKKWLTSFPFILLWYKYLCILFLALFLSAIQWFHFVVVSRCTWLSDLSYATFCSVLQYAVQNLKRHCLSSFAFLEKGFKGIQWCENNNAWFGCESCDIKHLICIWSCIILKQW